MAKKFLTGLNLVVLDTDPATGSEGELYFNSSASVAKIYQAGSWSILGAGGGGTTVSTTEPASPEIGDSWYKNDTGEFYVYDGTYWVEVNGVVENPGSVPIGGTVGQILAKVDDTDYNTEWIDNAAESTLYLVRNNTGATIPKGTLVAAAGAEPSGRIDVSPYETTGQQDSELRVMGVAIQNIANGVNGTVMSFGTLTGIDTRGTSVSPIAVGDETWAAGDILFAHPTVAGKLTKVRPQHDLAVAFITVRHASTGQIAVRIVPGNNHLEWMHDVLISGSVQNNEILSYDLSNGLWINKTANEAGILTEESASSTYLTQLSASMNYLTSDDAIMLYQPISVRLFNLTGLENVEGFLRTDGGLGWGVDTATYLTTESASSTYLTQVDAQEEYLTQIDALNTFLTFESLASASVYQPLDGNLTAIAALSGSPGFLKKNIFNEWVIDSNTYLTTYDASTTYQPTGNYATIDGSETLTNKTIDSPYVDGTITFNDIDYDHTISSASNNFTINAYQNLYLTTNTGSIILQPDEFVKIYNETVATQEWVEFQDYLTVSSASASYSQIDHNHTIDSLSNVEISGLVDGDSIVWSSASSAWINQVASGGSGATTTVSETSPATPSVGDSWYKPSTGSFFIYDGSYWVEVTSVITIDPTDTLSSVTARGATTSDAITISNTTQSTTPTTGALIISGGLGVSKDVWIDGDLHVNGATATLFSRSLSTRDNIIYLNESSPTEITNAVGDGTYVTYTAENDYLPGESIRITGVSPSVYNISSGELKTIYSATDTEFVVEKTDTGTYISGGDAYAKSAVNPDLGFAGGYNDGTYAHAGLFRDASDGVFKFFKGYVPEPDAAVNINTDHASFELADISVNDITALNATLSGSVSVGAIVSGSWSGDPISYSKGGTGLTSLGTSGQVLKVNSGATGLEWGTVDALPSQSGNDGKYLTTNGSTASWGTLDLSLYLTQSSASSTYATIVSPTLTTPNIGAATGTSLTTTGNIISHVDISTPTFVTNSYTITSTDDGKLLMLNNSTTAGNLLIPTDATYDFPIGTQINVVQQGTGLVTVGAVTPATTTINATPGKKLRAQWSSAAIVKTAANTWLLMGDLTV
jgi:hypothetical protein